MKKETKKQLDKLFPKEKLAEFMGKPHPDETISEMFERHNKQIKELDSKKMQLNLLKEGITGRSRFLWWNAIKGFFKGVFQGLWFLFKY